MAIETKSDGEKLLTFEIEIEGMPGKIVARRYDFYDEGKWYVELHGKWASYTGFHSIGHRTVKGERVEDFIHLARESYQEHAAYPFLVGAEHKAFGWKEIDFCAHSKTTTAKLPTWTAQDILETLKDIGLRSFGGLNDLWGTSDEKMTAGRLREILAPCLRPGTRFANPKELAGDIRAAFHKSTSKAASSQMSLF